MTYSHTKIEQKWQKHWTEKEIFKTDIHNHAKKKFYILDMFPYPSGKGLHVGHLRGYLASDILTRMKIMQGYNVFHPMGFDSFGLPTEQYSIKTGKDPEVFTEKNIQNFWKQLSLFGFTYDKSHIIKTHDPKYYRWTQWTFLKMLENNLVEQAKTEVNYCPKLNTVLANEEIIEVNDKMLSERGGHPVVRSEQKQWIIKITKFADKLIDGLKTIDWPESIKNAQINWIGKVKLWLIFLKIDQTAFELPVYFGNWIEIQNSEFILIAINNKKIDHLLTAKIKKELEKIRTKYNSEPLQNEKNLNKKLSGLNSNLFIWNPIQRKKIEIYFSEHVDVHFATGIRFGSVEKNIKDWFFANHHQILTKEKLQKAKEVKTEKKLTNTEIKEIKTDLKMAKIKIKKTSFFHLRDWIFARQRYWGEPFPLLHQNQKIVPLKEKDLPLKLPFISKDIFLKKERISPLSQLKNWTQAGYDINTMPQWAGSCWYFLAYLLKKPDNNFWPLNSLEAKEILHHWMPVDIYIGGQEHAVSHLLYARFWNYFLNKINCYDKKEPFQKLLNQGLILDKNGKKMSKSRGNVVNPNDFLISHGADAVRLWEKFLGPFEQKVYWKDEGLDGMRKWLARVYRLFITQKTFFVQKKTPNMEKINEKMIKKVTESYEKCNFNVAISELMKFINFCYQEKEINIVYGLNFLKLLHPICPHITEEIWFLWKQKGFLIHQPWPQWDESKLKNNKYKIIFQINGKKWKILEFEKESKNQIINQCKDMFKKNNKNKQIKKIIYIDRKIVNIVII